jgi:DNA topoisomerase-2
MKPFLIIIVSPEIDEDDSDGELYAKPSKKKKAAVNQVEPKTKKGAPVSRKISQSMKPASPPKPKKVVQKKWGGTSEDDEDGDLMDYDDLPKPPARSAVPARAARGARKIYVEILTEDEE